tara:strand:- start:232 stop:1239 length:1008 start_codon:yes stop_codon:yes gene_type:complete
MTPIQECILNKNHKINPIWIMRQAGRYLPEFREIRSLNPDFIKLCLNEDLSSEITLQPLKRFDLDAAIIFSDILMLPYGLGQNVKFKKNFGPELDLININEIKKTKEINFTNKLKPIYNLLERLSKNKIIKNNKDLIGFVGAPWTLLVYMINGKSPKLSLNKNFFEDKLLIRDLLEIIVKFLKIHIKKQIDSGATIIQIFDSWSGLLNEKDLPEYVYNPTLNLVNFIKDLNIPVICFPREIKNYTEFCTVVKPNAVSIDYNIDPNKILKDIDIPIQGGLDPKVLLKDFENIKKEVLKYYEIFRERPYVFNLGHGVLPETKPENVDYLVKLVKELK